MILVPKLIISEGYGCQNNKNQQVNHIKRRKYLQEIPLLPWISADEDAIGNETGHRGNERP